MTKLPNPDINGATYTILRTGTCKLTSWCWESGLLTLHWKVFAATNRLDAYGFVMDNRMIENYFHDTFEGKTLEASCEMIASNALVALCCRVEGCLLIEVSVSGNPDVTWLTARVDDPDLIHKIAEKEKARMQF